MFVLYHSLHWKTVLEGVEVKGELRNWDLLKSQDRIEMDFGYDDIGKDSLKD